MPRIFIPPEGITKDIAVLPEAEAKRLLKVLRMRPGDALTLFDGRAEYEAEITSLTSKSATARITAAVSRDTEPSLNVTLGHGYPKSEKFEWVLQKAAELGAVSVIPVMMERSVKRPDPADMERRLVRFRKIATEAAQQSGRLRAPDVPCFMDLPMFVEHTRPAGLKVILYEGERTKSLRQVLHGSKDIKSAAILIGPEGGLTKDEVLEAEAAGYVAAGLGPRILRTETAGLAALSIIQYELGDVG
jgi:16S rRNA (uracil1498-N3)-methyltransferase